MNALLWAHSRTGMLRLLQFTPPTGGTLRHTFPEIRLRVRGITTNALFYAWKGREPLLEFPEEEFETVNIIPEQMDFSFVRPGVHQRFIYVTRVPTSWKYILAHAKFMYKSSRELHTTEKAFEVKPDITAKPGAAAAL